MSLFFVFLEEAASSGYALAPFVEVPISLLEQNS